MSTADLVLIDTSVWVEVLRGSGATALKGEVESALNESRAAMTAPVWVELYRGVRGKKELEQLASLRRLCHWLAVDDETWEKTATTMRLCREKGVAVPMSDVLIFSCAQRFGVALLEKDNHFGLIAKAVRAEPALE